MNNIVLQTNNLTKKYGGFTALDNVSIQLEKKHIYGFIGENGAGKTTLMKIITGLSFPTAGTYSILGKASPRDREKMRRHIGSMIEDPALYPHYTIRQNLELQRTLVGNPDKAVCDEVLDLVGLADVKHKRVRTLSMGMKQRLSIAMALIGKPQILILDEPSTDWTPRTLSLCEICSRGWRKRKKSPFSSPATSSASFTSLPRTIFSFTKARSLMC